GEAARISGMSAASAANDTKRTSAEAGEVVALGKLDPVRTGDTLSSGKTAPRALTEIAAASPVLAIALAAVDRKDDV
ncbi:hypothetical protein, partial [Klebsiella pneumoniae]|uniref:hypothetical protein n=1 Tax=Klebsiella pneumoniae TaxID=573 RepID=UPI003720A7B3